MNKINLKNIDWCTVQRIHDGGVFWTNLSKQVNISIKVLNRAVNEGYLLKRKHKLVMTNETKKKMSVSRKKFLNENPDKHPWRKNNKFKSKPCEILKQCLINKNIIFIEEYQPFDDRYYSIDIAFPNHKIGVEVNGNQHYNRDGSLKKYYSDRNVHLKSIGWTTYDVHYSVIYNEYLLLQLVESISKYSLNNDELRKYENIYFNRIENNRIRQINLCIDCGKPIELESKRCSTCNGIFYRKVCRPNKEELIILVKNNTWRMIGKNYGVSDNAVRKWAKSYKII
jgi:very-short-patch-repair endonuclease